MTEEKIPFSEDELNVVGEVPETMFMAGLDVYDYPIPEHDAQCAALRGKPKWQMLGHESQIFTPRIMPDNVARAFVFENKPFDPETQGGGRDMFGVKWVYVPTAQGSMEDPDESHMLEDIFDWRDVIKFPDVDSWDWEGSAAENNGTYLTDKKFNQVWIQTGWFERLISFMGFENAAICMVMEDEMEEAKELYDALSDLYIDIIDHYVKYFDHIDGFYIHDDWGSSQNAFFSPDACEELIVPAMRRVTDHIHELGLTAELHSCGNNIKQVPNMIKAGWDAWIPQCDVNDTEKIYAEYGDQIVLGMEPEMFDPETTTEEEQRAYARAYAAKYCNPEKPTLFNYMYGFGKLLTPAFREELYIESRKRYCA